MKKIIEYKRGVDFIKKLLSEYPKGELKVICPHCKDEMLVILDPKSVSKHQRSKGVYCPNGHIQVVYNIKK